jgi:hypothetical protein
MWWSYMANIKIDFNIYKLKEAGGNVLRKNRRDTELVQKLATQRTLSC